MTYHDVQEFLRIWSSSVDFPKFCTFCFEKRGNHRYNFWDLVATRAVISFKTHTSCGCIQHSTALCSGLQLLCENGKVRWKAIEFTWLIQGINYHFTIELGWNQIIWHGPPNQSLKLLNVHCEVWSVSKEDIMERSEYIVGSSCTNQRGTHINSLRPSDAHMRR